MVMSQTNIESKVTGKILITGNIRNITPLIMGKGEGEIIDKEIVRGYGDVPYIPATAFVGVMKSYIRPNLNNEKERYFWGGEKDSDMQSHFIVDDLLPINNETPPKTIIRDGIRISPATGIVEDKKKFSYEVLEPGTRFIMRCEITLRESLQFNDFENSIRNILSALNASDISFGSMTMRGFGRIILEDDWKVYHFNFSKGEGPIWLEYMATDMLPANKASVQLTLHSTTRVTHALKIEALFNLKSSLIVGSYPSDTHLPDKVHIQSCGQPVLPGTSIRGAIRSRAERIINTLGGKSEELLNEVFGWVDDSPGFIKKRAIKSLVIVEETILRNVEAEIQSRIKIDRFTGGTADTALFDSMPVWRGQGGPQVVIKISMREYSEEKRWIAGLLLQVMKDLWTGDLPIGGEKAIGRGVLQGLKACISLGKKGKWTIEAQGVNNLKILGNEDERELEVCADALVAKCLGTHGREE